MIVALSEIAMLCSDVHPPKALFPISLNVGSPLEIPISKCRPSNEDSNVYYLCSTIFQVFQ
jgi:hypothetical protein